jgi:tripartite-type tricarboxylate transporter receptor subunit TctC
MRSIAKSVQLLVGVVMSAVLLTAFAEASWPTKPVRLIVTYPAGGMSDTLTRLVAVPFGSIVGQPVIVENASGATGQVGVGEAARAASDGYTLLMAGVSNLVANRFTQRKLPYDPDAFEPVTVVAFFPLVLVGNPDLPGRGIAELVAYAKAHPGKLTYASYGVGSASHFQMEMFKLATGLDLLHVPFRGASDAPPAVMRGEVSLYFAPPASVISQYKAGKLKGYAVASDARLGAMPAVPTFREQGYSGVDLPIWIGIMAPRGTPRAIRDKAQATFATVLKTREIAERFAGFGARPIGNTPDEFEALIKSDVVRYGQLAERIGMVPQ